MSTSRPHPISLHPSKITSAGGTPVHPNLLANPTDSQSTPSSHYPYQDMRRRRIKSPDLGDTLQLPPPKRKILNPSHVQLWLQSEAFFRLGWFITTVNRACQGVTIDLANNLIDPHESSELGRILCMLERLDTWISNIPLGPRTGRFGNLAYRVFIEKLESEIDQLLNSVIGVNGTTTAALHVYRQELKVYLTESFGNGVRLDYGSGHELSFVIWLMVLELVGFFSCDAEADNDQQRSIFLGIGLIIMPAYLKLVRRLQQIYNLEPAGSHGVWGLDDFQFLPYYWGASQLIDHAHLKPSVVTDRETVGHFSSQFLYLSCIDYIYQSKQGPFFEHSPMLYDISGVGTWSKVNSGLLKMYTAEVLSKFPIVQHIKFGYLFPFRPVDL